MTEPNAAKRSLTVYQGRCSAFLGWSEPFLYRLLKSLEPHVRQVVLTQRVENADMYPMPIIERLNTRTLFNPYQGHRAACRLQRRYRGDLLHAHLGATAPKLLLLKQLMRIPMVVTFGGKDLTVTAKRPATQQVYRHIFEIVEQMVAVSDDLRRQAIAVGCPPEKIVTVHRGVSLDRFPFVDRAGHDPRRVGILMVSRLVQKKGHADAVRALAMLPAVVPEWHLTILGEGPKEGPLHRQLAETGLSGRVRFLGSVPIERVREEMSKADILLHPSVTGGDGDREGIPNALMEGQATGLPVVATEHGGIPEIIRHGETGLLVPERDAAGLAEMLRRLLESRELRLRLGRSGHETVSREFSLDRQVRRYLEIYHDLAERYPHGCAELKRLRTMGPILEMLHASRYEARAKGDLSVSEWIEDAVIRADGDSDAAEPWWYSAFWRLKRYVPREIKFRMKLTLFRLFRDSFRSSFMLVSTREDRVWQVLRQYGIPDPFEPPRSLADFEATLAASEEHLSAKRNRAQGCRTKKKN